MTEDDGSRRESIDSNNSLHEEDELHMAARAGILLLEQNQTLLKEKEQLSKQNQDFQRQIENLIHERDMYEQKMRNEKGNLETVNLQRRKSIVEFNLLHNEVREKNMQLEKEKQKTSHLLETISETQRHRKNLEDLVSSLNVEIEHNKSQYNLLKKQLEDCEASLENDGKDTEQTDFDDEIVDRSLNGSNTDELEQLEKKLNDALEVGRSQVSEIKTLKKDIDVLRAESKDHADILDEKKFLDAKLQKCMQELQHMKESQDEERELISSLRTMAQTYKRIAESRPFSSSSVENKLDMPNEGQSIRQELSKENAQLAEKNSQLMLKLEMLQSNQQVEIPIPLSNSSVESEFSLPTSPMSADSHIDLSRRFHELQATYNKLKEKNQNLEEDLIESSKSLSHVKSQWSSAVASQRMLQECNDVSQAEIDRLSEQLKYEMNRKKAVEVPQTIGYEKFKNIQSESNEENWMEDTSAHPAPPGDLNSPLIKCLLENWTSEKSKLMKLTDWLHNTIRGTGKTKPFHLECLSPEVSAGFLQLLVPILQQTHNIPLSVYKRHKPQIMTDLILQRAKPTHEGNNNHNCTTVDETVFLYGA